MREDLSDFKGTKSFAIMGGTFDPIHYGHLATAEAVRHQFNIDKVFFIPTGRPAHKDESKVTLNEHRYLMCVLATVTNPYFKVSRIELDRTGKTYTIDTVREIKKLCGENVKLYFITGADAILDMPKWKDFKELLAACDFIAVTRPGYKKHELFNEIDNLQEVFESKIHFLEVPALDISSSDIRRKIRNNFPVKYLLPETVEEYINKFELYKNDSNSYANDFENIKQKLQSALSIEKYVHTLGVVAEAEKLANKYGADKEKAALAAMLHDCAKDYPPDLKLRLAKEYHVSINEIIEKNIDLVHPFLGAEVAKREYGVTDEEVLNAIRYHTTGRAGMTLLEKIIYIADYIEVNREPFDGLDMARKLAYTDLDLALCFILQNTVDYVRARGKLLHPLSLEALEYYNNK